MNVYSVEVYSNGWKYNSAAGDIECATLVGILALDGNFGEKFSDGDCEWEMNISMVNVL